MAGIKNRKLLSLNLPQKYSRHDTPLKGQKEVSCVTVLFNFASNNYVTFIYIHVETEKMRKVQFLTNKSSMGLIKLHVTVLTKFITHLPLHYLHFTQTLLNIYDVQIRHFENKYLCPEHVHNFLSTPKETGIRNLTRYTEHFKGHPKFKKLFWKLKVTPGQFNLVLTL